MLVQRQAKPLQRGGGEVRRGTRRGSREKRRGGERERRRGGERGKGEGKRENKGGGRGKRKGEKVKLRMGGGRREKGTIGLGRERVFLKQDERGNVEKGAETRKGAGSKRNNESFEDVKCAGKTYMPILLLCFHQFSVQVHTRM